MKKNKTFGLLQYRFYNLPAETLWLYLFVLGGAIVTVMLGWTTVATGIFLWLLPSFINFNGMETTERKNTKLQLSFPISRKQNVDIRYLSFIVINLIAIAIGFVFYLLTDFFISLDIVSVLSVDLGPLNWLFSQVPFLTVVKVVLGFTLFNTAFYYGLSYTVFKKVGKPPFWVNLGIIAIYMWADSYIGLLNLTWEQMPTVMFGTSLVLFVISYFVSVKAFKKLDFS